MRKLLILLLFSIPAWGQITDYNVPRSGVGLNVCIGPGSNAMSGSPVKYAGSCLGPFGINTTTFGYLDPSTGNLLTNTSGAPSGSCPIFEADTNQFVVTAVRDKRLSFCSGGGLATLPTAALGSVLASQGAGITTTFQTKPIQDVRDNTGIDCTGATDSSTAFNALTNNVNLINGKQVQFTSGCQPEVTSPWVIKNLSAFRITSVAGTGSNGFQISPTIAYCGSTASDQVLDLEYTNGGILDGLAVNSQKTGCATGSQTAIRVDKFGTCAGCVNQTNMTFRNIGVESSSTSTPNANWIGMDFSPNQTNNVEAMKVEDFSCYAQSSTNGICLRINSANAKGEVFQRLNLNGQYPTATNQTFFSSVNGSFAINDAFASNANTDITLTNITDPSYITDWISEQSGQAFSTNGLTWPVGLLFSHWDFTNIDLTRFVFDEANTPGSGGASPFIMIGTGQDNDASITKWRRANTIISIGSQAPNSTCVNLANGTLSACDDITTNNNGQAIIIGDCSTAPSTKCSGIDVASNNGQGGAISTSSPGIQLSPRGSWTTANLMNSPPLYFVGVNGFSGATSPLAVTFPLYLHVSGATNAVNAVLTLDTPVITNKASSGVDFSTADFLKGNQVQANSTVVQDSGVFGSSTTNTSAACETSFGITTLNTGATTTNTGLNCLPATSVIDAVVYRITTTITVAANFTIGDSTTAARFCSTQSTLTAGTTGVCFVQADQTGAAGPRQTTAASVRVTTNANPGAGAIRLIVYYHTWTAPTS